MLSVIPVEKFEETYFSLVYEGLENYLTFDSSGLIIDIPSNEFDFLDFTNKLRRRNLKPFNISYRQDSVRGYLCFADTVNDSA